MKTFMAKLETITRAWYLVDATGKIRTGAAPSFHGGRSPAAQAIAFNRAARMFPRWQYHGRAEISRDGDH